MGYVYRDRRGDRELWAIAYADVDGRLRKERTRASNRTLARRILSDREDAVERAKLQKLPSVRDLIKPKTALTVRQFSEEYMAHVEAHCTPSTAKRYRNILKTHLLGAFGPMTLREINPGHVQKFADGRLGEAAAATVRQEMMLISGMFREAMKRDLVERNPVAQTDKPAVHNEIVRYLDPDEEERLLAVAPEPLCSGIVISIDTGLRDGELRNLTWTDVRFREGAIVVRRTKNKKDRMVPMTQRVREVLEKRPRHISSPYVFTSPRTGTRYDRFDNTTWREIIKRAGIRNFRWHDLRHTYGSRLAQSGASILVIKELMGHSQITVTMRYAHLAPSNMREAVRVMEEYFGGPGAAKNTTHGTTHGQKKAPERTAKNAATT